MPAPPAPAPGRVSPSFRTPELLHPAKSSATQPLVEGVTSHTYNPAAERPADASAASAAQLVRTQSQRAGVTTAAEAEVRPPLGSSGTVPRRRTQRNKVSDAQVMARLQAVCMPGNPTRMFKDLVKIGQGASGGVFTAKSIGSEQLVAIKQMVLEQQPKKDLIVNEIEVMKQSRHPNIVNFLNAFLNDGELWVVMEYMEGGPLTDVVLNSILSEAQIAAVTKECLTGLHHLHTHGVIHRDIKSDNVLMSMNGNIKLSTSPPLTQPTLASVHRSARRTPSASPWSARRTGWRPRWSHGKSTAHASTSGAWAFCASRWSKASRRT